MTSVVMTGRRMKSAERFTAVRLRHAPGARRRGRRETSRNWPSVTTVSPGCEAARDHGRLVGRALDRHRAASTAVESGSTT